MKTKDIALKDKNYFQIFIGKRILKKSVFRSGSSIPAYSANVFEPFGYVEDSNISDFKYNYILWAIDGNFESSIKHIGKKFATTDHCGTIKILDPSISPEYLLNCLNLKKYELGFDRSFRPSLSNMENVNVTIPVNDDGTFDVVEQDKATTKYEQIRKTMNPVRSAYERLTNITLKIDDAGETQKLKISDIFEPPIKGKSTYTKAYITKHGGQYPVYSSKTADEGILGFIDTYDYETTCLTWTTDGIYAGTVFFRKDKQFSMTDHCGTLMLKTEHSDKIDLEYIRYGLQAKLKEYARGEGKKRVKVNVVRDATIEIPVDKKGQFDSAEQKRIADKYKTLYNMKQDVVQHLQELSKVVVKM
jgi:restriction endonuclease S subunit